MEKIYNLLSINKSTGIFGRTDNTDSATHITNDQPHPTGISRGNASHNLLSIPSSPSLNVPTSATSSTIENKKKSRKSDRPLSSSSIRLLDSKNNNINGADDNANKPIEGSKNKVHKRSLEYFRSYNLSRDQFPYKVLTDINWWPDEILTFIEVLRMAYTDFITIYTSSSAIFDSPLRNAIFFMNQKKYEKLEHIDYFLKLSDFKINDNYLNVMINEDNCHMQGMGDHPRSKNENKHHLLVKALEQLVGAGQVSDGDLILKKEYEENIKIYIYFYHLRHAYETIDDTLRNLLYAAISDIQIGLDIRQLFNDMHDEMLEKQGNLFRRINNQKLFNKSCILNDLLLYGLYSTTLFNFVFTFARRQTSVTPKASFESKVPETKRVDKKASYNPPVLPQEALYPFNSMNSKTGDHSSKFTYTVVNRIQYVYKYFLHIILMHKEKTDNLIKIISENMDFEELITENKSDNLTLIAPRYMIRSMKSSEPEHLINTFIMDLPEDKLSIESRNDIDNHRASATNGGSFSEGQSASSLQLTSNINKGYHMRKISIDSFISPRRERILHVPRQDTPNNPSVITKHSH